MNDVWIDRLSEYLDDELDASERAELEAHLRSCAECTTLLGELRQVVQQARSLEDRAPERDLWTGIAARISSGAEVKPAELNFQQHAARRRTRVSFSVPQLIAAGILLMLVSGASVWLVLSSARSTGLSPIGGGTIATTAGAAPATDSVEETVAPLPNDAGVAAPAAGTQPDRFAAAPAPRRAAPRTSVARNAATGPAPTTAPRPYDTAIADLQTVLREGRTSLDPETVRALEDNLRVIDRAIADARSALARDTANVYLNEHLINNMQRKLELLRRATAIVSGQS